jgi:hypothetical protein
MESSESMFVDQLRVIVTIMAINLLQLGLPKDPFRGFYYYAVEPSFTNAPGNRRNTFISFSA